MHTFKNKIEIIGINPFVRLPVRVLKSLFADAKKDKGPIPVCGTIDGHAYRQTLVKYSGLWRLYINGPMMKSASVKVGDRVDITIAFDSTERTIPFHPKLKGALARSKKAKLIFDQLAPSRKKEIVRYISFLKSEASVERNVKKVIGFLLGKERFVGREKP